MLRLILPLAFLLAACDTYLEDKRSLEFAPLYVPEQDAGSDDPAYGAIFNPNSGGLFSMESRAHRVGDILTVAFAESFQATKSQNAATSRSSDNTITVPGVLGGVLPKSTDLAAGGESSFSGSGTSAQSNTLTGSVSVHVVRVFANGNLEILGQKKLTLNNGDEYIRVSGIVRPKDISSENIIQSDRIANADINYVGAGDLARTGKKGWYTKLFETVSPI